MNILSKIWIGIKYFLKKLFISNYIKQLMKAYGKVVKSDVDKKKLKMLTTAIFNASKIVKKEIAEEMLNNKKYKDEQFLKDLKNTINKHYDDKIKILTKKNETFSKQTNDALYKLNKIKKQLKIIEI